MGKFIQYVLVAFIIAASMTAWFQQGQLAIVELELLHIPVFFVVMFGLGLFIVDDVQQSFKKVLRFYERQDTRPLWQVGIGMLFFFAQIGFVEVFARSWMTPALDGMPLYIVFSFMNAFLATVIYEELFYEPARAAQFKFKKLK